MSSITNAQIAASLAAIAARLDSVEARLAPQAALQAPAAKPKASPTPKAQPKAEVKLYRSVRAKLANGEAVTPEELAKLHPSTAAVYIARGEAARGLGRTTKSGRVTMRTLNDRQLVKAVAKVLAGK